MGERKKIKVFVSGPYTKGDVAQNVKAAIHAADMLTTCGYIPFVPHLTHFWHMIYPHSYEFWCEQDNEWLLVCNVVLRLPGESAGSDAETKLAEEHGIPVYYDIDSILHDFGDFTSVRNI